MEIVEMPWLLVLVGLIIGLFVRNIWYTYRKVVKEGKKFDWSYVATGVLTAIITAIGLMTGAEHIEIPEYMIEKGWWALLTLGFMIGVGGNDILNAILKLVKKDKIEIPEIPTEPEKTEEPKEDG